MSSLQLQRYCAARIADTPIEIAAETSGLGIDCAKLWEADRERGESDFKAIAAQSEERIMSNVVAADQLRLFIERIERLEEEKRGLADDVKDVYSEAKSNGYDTKTMRKIVALRKLEPHVRTEAEMLLATYCQALGIQHSFDM